MGIIAWIIVGLVAGAIANLIYPGRSQGGWLAAMVLGIVGALVGGFLAGVVTGEDFISGINISTILVSVLGALLLLFGYNALARPRSA
jgi:uncharacterized membrane protein YeaQ/YmgE (transglycosylase-associated protein family)